MDVISVSTNFRIGHLLYWSLEQALQCIADAGQDLFLVKEDNLMLGRVDIHIHLITWQLDILQHH